MTLTFDLLSPNYDAFISVNMISCRVFDTFSPKVTSMTHFGTFHDAHTRTNRTKIVCSASGHTTLGRGMKIDIYTIDRCVGGIMFSGRPSVSVCVHLGVSSVSTISYKPVGGISPNFG